MNEQILRILITAGAGCALSGVLGHFLLPVLRALKAGQSLRDIGALGDLPESNQLDLFASMF